MCDRLRKHHFHPFIHVFPPPSSLFPASIRTGLVKRASGDVRAKLQVLMVQVYNETLLQPRSQSADVIHRTHALERCTLCLLSTRSVCEKVAVRRRFDLTRSRCLRSLLKRGHLWEVWEVGGGLRTNPDAAVGVPVFVEPPEVHSRQTFSDVLSMM